MKNLRSKIPPPILVIIIFLIYILSKMKTANTDIAVKELLDLLLRKRVLKQKEVDQLLESAKTHFNEVPEEPDIT